MPPRGKRPAGRQGPRYDLDEVRPNLFVLGNPHIQGLLKGEGEITGTFFRLVGWRREGLLARIRERNFTVRTLSDQLDKLPLPRASQGDGRLLLREVGAERRGYAVFDNTSLQWQPLTPQQQDDGQVVALLEGAVVRVRRGRGASSFFRVVDARGRADLVPTNEDEALLQAYAPFAAKPRSLQLQRRSEGYLLPKSVVLPPSYRTFLGLLGEATPDGLLIDDAGWKLAKQALLKLGLKPATGGK
jgi:hypothetical protein